MRGQFRSLPARWALATFALGPLLAGCGESLPPTVPVEGAVTWRGSPLAEGEVVFQPDVIAEGLPIRPATGTLQDDGTYRLSTFRPGDGAVSGKYHVLIHSYVSQPSFDDPFAPFIWRIPARYGDPLHSGLTATVPADSRALVLDFELTE